LALLRLVRPHLGDCLQFFIPKSGRALTVKRRIKHMVKTEIQGREDNESLQKPEKVQ